MTKKRNQPQKPLSPQARAALAVKALIDLTDEIEMAAASGQMHPNAVYTKQKPKVVTMSGQGASMVIVGAVVPFGLLKEIQTIAREMQENADPEGKEGAVTGAVN